MKNKIFITISLISVLSLFLILYLQNKNKEKTNDFTPIRYIEIDKVNIGTNKEEVEKQIGKEITSISSGDLLISDYKSKNIYRPHQIYYRNNKAILIIEKVVDKSVTTDKMIEKYGSPTDVLYEELENSTFNLFVLPDKGVAYIGHENGGLVLEIWYFEPTTIENFIKDNAQNYQRTPYTEQTGY